MRRVMKCLLAGKEPGDLSTIEEEALWTMRLLEKGTQQAFLDGELGVEDTKLRLDEIEKARKRCEAGDINACQVLDGLVAGLTRKRE